LSTRYSSEGIASERLKCIGSSFMSFAVSLFAYCNFPEWGEPLMCQLRNRLLSLQILNAVGRKSGIGEWLSGSDFNPGVSWTPPGKQV
jgi:endoribonuclease Dicer